MSEDLFPFHKNISTLLLNCYYWRKYLLIWNATTFNAKYTSFVRFFFFTENEDTNDDDNDPEYNYLAEAEEEDIDMEDFRCDRAVQVSSKSF